MASTTNVHVNDAGVQILVTINDEYGVVNLNSATDIELWFQKPDRTVVQRVCQIASPTAGLVSYTTAATDFDQAGLWRLQFVIRLSGGMVKHSDIGTINVLANLS